MTSISKTLEWQALEGHRDELAPRHLRDLFADEPGRFSTLSRSIDGALFDFSKQRITPQTIARLCALAPSRGPASGTGRPRQTGALFSANARAPSFWSSLP